ncbi:electron transfer flavoprotein subunit beta/FixA family protein [Nocardioides donggukensis]|uniref:Electron transfer flavoprotein subunit beta/FixA family protein n=1 Tax=Nocardioides donggukensis TaxID=2774019 RepID=A0A927K140_9ACTN|nr:electron transfer flavoprotein subunit beta/FixA family protein [Nocardioides donggukensis]MBD8868167.1 electron transfer flavoprotein subunit beta/FixA family protein [Nocardioides donggukensis]
MTRVLVCVKRVPDSSGEVVLTDDGQAVDGRYAGFTISDHENCAVELGIRLADATGGSVTVLTVGPAEAVDQLRAALALGAGAAVHVQADPARLGPDDVAHEIAAVVRDHRAAGAAYDLVLLGNDASDSGDFQVPVRLGYRLGLPIVTGASTAEVTGDRVIAEADGPEGRETYSVPLPAVVSVLEGGVEPRYPTMRGRMAARKIEVETRQPTREPVGPSRVRLLLPPPAPATAEVLGEGPEAAPAVVDLFERLGVGR